MNTNSPPPYKGVTYLEPYQGYRTKILMQCNNCSHQWNTTPQTIQQSNKKYDANGCPKCLHERRYAEKRKAYLARCPSHIDILSDYDGTQRYTGQHVHFRNNNCGHDFWTVPTDVIIGRVDCSICGDIKRTTKRNINNSLRKVHDPESWKRYQNDCAYMSDKAFYANESLLNPNGYPRTLAGVPGGHQLDHILPKAVGYAIDIPAELMSHIDNLRYIPWEENRQKSASLQEIPAIFEEYREAILEYYKDAVI